MNTNDKAALALATRQLATNGIEIVHKCGGFQLIDRAGSDTVIDMGLGFDFDRGIFRHRPADHAAKSRGGLRLRGPARGREVKGNLAL